MSVEVEKKYRLTDDERERVVQKLRESNAQFGGDEFEENTLYRGQRLNPKTVALRLRRTDKRAVLTYKKQLPTESAIKRRIEHETEVADATAINLILESLGFLPALVYEKRRQTWRLSGAEIVLDELPFGWYMEIEAAENDILIVERQLQIESLRVETKTYPSLTVQHGARSGEAIEARFEKADLLTSNAD